MNTLPSFNKDIIKEEEKKLYEEYKRKLAELKKTHKEKSTNTSIFTKGLLPIYVLYLLSLGPTNGNEISKKIDDFIKEQMYKLAKVINIYGYTRVDAFVKIFGERVELWIIEINSLPALTPATCLFHQAALNGYKPIDLINMIINSGCKR